MKKHKFNFLPEMQVEERERVKRDILAHGYDKTQPIYTLNGDILDGWNRWLICQEIKVKPEMVEFTGTDFEAVNFVMRTNKRRNLTSSQWAAIAIEAKDIVQIIENEVENERKKKISEEMGGNKNQIGGEPQMGQKIDPSVETPAPRDNAKRAASKVAEVFNTNRQYISDIANIKESKPEVFEEIKKGNKTIAEAKKEEKIQKRKEEIEEIKRKIENEPKKDIDQKYNVLVIDPPWPYGREYDPENSRVANPYPEMPIEEIKKIKLPLEEDAVVFLWTTHAFLKNSFLLLEGWGLTYKATLVWDKEKMGMGSTIRMQCEFCLLAIKGKPIIQGSAERDIIRESRREHSRKPDAFYDMVDRMTIGKKLDYFSRTQRKGWDTYGAETNKF
jgi:N6-adenosine-specific RNA methylase IME4